MAKKRRREGGKSTPEKKEKRSIRVVCVTGTPGVGKTTACALVKEKLGEKEFEFVNIGDLIKEKKLYTEWDDEMNCSIFDDDLVGDELKRIVKEMGAKGKKGILIDFHSVGFMGKKLVDHVLVMRADTETLWTRLEARGYKEAKIKENVEAEIFMESMNDAVDRFDEGIVSEITNNTENDQKLVVGKIVSLLTGSS
jgi:adenylate kinase